MEKRILLAAIFSIVFLIGSVNAVAATTITFTEVFTPPPTSQTLTGSEWSAYGITTSNAYWYYDTRDPVDANGISQTQNPARVDFITPTNAVTIDWTTIASQDIHVEAYDSSDNLLDSFVYTGLTGTMSGTDTLTGTGISYILFYDNAGFVGISTLSFIPALEATINIDPDSLNLKSRGEWITCYIELPEGYDVADIDVSTILLEDEIPAEAHPTEIGDHDDDGIADLMVKFDRSAVQEILEEGEGVEITVTGELTDETVFEGSDTIRVIDE